MTSFCLLPPPPLSELPIADQVKIEALAHGRRHEAARQLSATVKGPGAQAYRFADTIRAIADQLDQADAEERRRAEERRLRTPSGLIAEMRDNWPGQSAAVRAMARRLDLNLGEAWALVIAAGVETVARKNRRKG